MMRILPMLFIFMLAPVLWLWAEIRGRIAFRIAGSLLFVVVSVLVASWWRCFPLQQAFATARFCHYGSARSMVSLLDKGDTSSVTNALTAFLATEGDWNSYPPAVHELAKRLDQVGK